MSKMISDSEWIKRFKSVHGDKYDYSYTENCTGKNKITVICKTHGEFKITSGHHYYRRQGCPMCNKSKKLTLETVKTLLNKINPMIEILSEEYVNSWSKIKVRCLIDEHTWYVPWDSLKQGHGCPKCAGNQRYTTEEFVGYMCIKNNNILILSEYVDDKTKVKCECLTKDCGYIWFASPTHLKQGKGCPCCAGKVLTDKNRLSSCRPDLVKYFKNSEDADNYTVKSSKKVELVCFECGTPKIMSICKLTEYGFSCNCCGDGFSVPSKFFYNVFKQAKLNFDTEVKFDWSENRRYDFILFKDNVVIDSDILIEVDGMQHKSECSLTQRTLEEEIKNDKLKENLAYLNGYRLIRIPADYSDFDYLKQVAHNCLSEYVNIDNIDWNSLWLNCSKSIVKQTWDLFNSGLSVKQISKELKISDVSVRKYLHRGNKINATNYHPKKLDLLKTSIKEVIE